MTEYFLHFIWKYGLFDRNGMFTDTGEEVHVTGLGEHNTDAGPDFLNARVRIGSTNWAGNVEIHLRSSDWITHKHQHDKAYDNVILHVVHSYDRPVTRNNGEIVPTVVLTFDNQLYDNYCKLLAQHQGLSCHDKIRKVDPLIVDVWLNSLVIERLQQKTGHIAGLLSQYINNWEEVFYICLARTFGFGLNAMPFEMTAASIPYACIARHRNNLMQVEAILMGQAGFLEEALLFNSYYVDLRNEYIHLKKKYGLRPVAKHLWKFLRLRPVNFPTIRLAQFAAILQKSEGLFSKVLACEKTSELSALFDVSASCFWDTHYTFNTESPVVHKKIGNEAINTIIINAVIPLLFIYGKLKGNDLLKDRTLQWLNQIPPERNRVINRWTAYGIEPASAFYSQGILQLVNTYCNRKRCLACSIGTHLITSGDRDL